jgi:hypothetical protein
MRYTSEISLRLVGDRAKAARYISRARTVLGALWNQDIRLGGNDQAWRRVELGFENVVIDVRVVRGLPPFVTITASGEAEQRAFRGRALLLAAWYPEGLLFTPRSAAEPQGRGLPTRDPETGEVLENPTTSDPVFPQVLLNRFTNNKYLDRAPFVAGTVYAADGLPTDPAWLREDPSEDGNFGEISFRYMHKIARPLDYADAEFTYDGFEYWQDFDNQSQYPTIPGEYLVTEEIVQGRAVQVATLLVEQKDRITGEDLIFEGESTEEWFAHRPEEILYPTPAHEEIFIRTNAYRQLFLAPPLHRQLRGDGNPAAMVVGEVARSGDISHNSLNFRPGFRTADGRVLNATGVDQTSGENLAGGFTGTTEDVGTDVAAAWYGSTGHRNNMLSVAWDNDATIPGAQHSIGYTEGTITEQSEDIPDINTYPGGSITGGIWSQIFHKRAAWAAAWRFVHEGAYGETGWDGFGGPDDNAALVTLDADTLNVQPFESYFGFRGCRYVLPNSADEEKAVRMLAATVYAKDVTVGDETVQELWFRVALYLNDIGENFQNATTQAYGDGKIQIFTAPVGVTEANYKDRYGYYEPDPEREWELEGEYEFPLALNPEDDNEGWLYLAFGKPAISFDGRKFCFTYQKYRIDEQALLHRSSDDFGQSLDRNVLVTWMVHIEKDVDGDWVLHEKLPPEVTVSATQVQGGANFINNYSRSLATQYDFMPYYDDEDELQYVVLDINESQTQQSSGRYWKVHKLIFGSGKEVLLEYQALDNIITPSSLQNFLLAHPTFPYEDGEEGVFTTTLHYIDPVEEDVVYTRYYYRYVDPAPGDLLGNITYYDKHELVVSAGSAEDVVVWRREDNWTTTPFFTLSGQLIFQNSTAWSGTGPWTTGTERTLRTPNAYSVYNYKSPWAAILGYRGSGFGFTTSGTWTASVIQQRQAWPFAFAQLGVPWNPQYPDQYDTRYYTDPYATLGMHNAESYTASIWQPPTLFLGAQKESNLVLRDTFGDLIDASLYTDNLAPRFGGSPNSDVTFVKYRDRWMLRASFRAAPRALYAAINGQTGLATFPDYDDFDLPPFPTESEAVGEYTRINEGSSTSLLVSANFDLDAAAEIEDVIDIQPFGRAL